MTAKRIPGFLQIITNDVPPDLQQKINQSPDSFEVFALVGKWLIRNKKLSPAVLQYLAKSTSNVVNYGVIRPTAVWVIPKPSEQFLRDRQGTFNTCNGYTAYAKRFGKKTQLAARGRRIASTSLAHPDFLYHSSDPANREAIRQQGLDHTLSDAYQVAAEPEKILVIVHPGSACGSADFNYGSRSAADAERNGLIHEWNNWQGGAIVIDGELSDELPDYPELNAALTGVVDRAKAAGRTSIREYGQDPAQMQVIRKVVKEKG
jgi:hypothetical protein